MALMKVDVKVFPTTMTLMDPLRADEILGLKPKESLSVNGLTITRRSSRMWTVTGEADKINSVLRVLKKARSTINDPVPVES